MARAPRQVFKKKDRVSAIKLVLEQNVSITEVAQQFNIPEKTLEIWIKKATATQSANLTGGKGFSLESQVGAWFLIHMLAGVPPLDENLGSLKRLAFQTGPDGWQLDDLLLTCQMKDTIHRCAISIKSNRQFTAQKAPKDFVERCWSQFLEIKDNPFSPETDRLVNITAELPSVTRDSLFSLLKAARVRDPAEMVKQLANGDLSVNARAMFQSFACPTDLASKYQIGAEKIPELLRCVSVRSLNLEDPNSTDKAHALGLCRQILKTGDLQTATELWEALVSLVDRHRVDRGHIDLPVVLQALRHRFPFKDHPNYADDWNRLWTDSKERWQSVIDVIGGKTRLPRNHLLQTIEEKFSNHRVVVLLGEQGGGKSVTARHWAEHRSKNEPVLWLDPRTFEINDLSELRDRLRLNHSWRELIDGLTRPRMTVILDGLDRLLLLQPETITVTGQLLNTLVDTEKESPFQILLACQERAWEEVQIALLQTGLPVTAWPEITVQPVSTEELLSLIADFPALRALSFQDRLIAILRQPKILDLLARNTEVGKLPNFRAWAGESDVIDWIWKAEIEGKKPATSRQRLMWQLAEELAKRLSVDVPIDVFGDVADVALDNLNTDRICQCKNGRVSFSHDLWGDWARQRLLLAHEPELLEYLEKRLDSPAWHRAIVLLGLDLLERQSKPERWHELMGRSDTLENGGTLFCDLFLESLIHAAQTTDALTQAWPQLCAEEGIWLRRLLIRFLHVATSPNPIMLEYVKSNKGLSEALAATINRIPKPELWGAMLKFLNAHRDECADLAPLQVAEIAERWLCWTVTDMPLRKEAADLALAVAWSTLRDQQHWRSRHYSSRRYTRGDSKAITQKAYFAALQAVRERLDEVIDFALCACGRSKPTEPLPPDLKFEAPAPPLPPELEAALNYVSPWKKFEIEIPAWTDGPRWPVDDHFRNVCLHQFGLLRLIALSPERAAEIILALIIREGGTRLPENDFESLHFDFELTDCSQWFPPFYDRGPFLNLLSTHSAIGLETVIMLVNFTTDRWLELQKWREANERDSEWFPREKINFDIRIPFDDEEQIWVGDERWFFSYRDTTSAPDILVSALMALEKWFHDQLDQNQVIENIVIDILSRTRSLALAGLLIGVGRREPKLFLGPLLPFLGVPEIYHFDLKHQIGGERHQMLGWGYGHSQKQYEAAKEWHGMPHRTKWLEHIVFELQCRSSTFRDRIDDIRIAWHERLKKEDIGGSRDDLLFRLYHQFNLKNWRCEPGTENNLKFQFQEPEEMLTRNRDEQQLHEVRQVIMYLPFQFRKIIDGKQELSETEFEQLRERVETLIDLDFDEVFDKQSLVSKEDIGCGLIAVAVCKFRNWLKSKEGEESDCLNALIEIVSNPPPRREFDVAELTSDSSWDSFCADALPILWADNQSEPKIRQAIGNLVFNLHYETVKRLFRQIATIRDQLSDDYLRLQHLLLRWSVLRDRINVLNGRLFGQESSSSEELIEEADGLLRQFVDGSLSPNIPQWKALDHAFNDNQPSLCEPSTKKYYPRSPCIDLQLISSAYEWITGLDKAHNEIERNLWLEFWVQSVETLCWILGEGSPEIEKIDGTPYEFDRWLFQKLPSILVSTKNTHEAESLWRPILKLGIPAHYWIDDFLNDWWIYGFPNDAKKQQYFLSIWKDMWEFTRTSLAWNVAAKRSWDMNKSYCALMGLGELTLAFDFWNVDKIPLVKVMTEEFRLWGELHLSNNTCAQAFIKFLLTPAACSLQVAGMKWLDQTIAQHGFWHDSYRRIDKQLADLLDHCQKLIERDIDTRTVFFRLLRILVERQNSQAMVLQDRLNR
ncbi:transposase [Methylobacter sp. sgz302048]|uniref:transposase n=1 Tax=Methylobacter sp. sgz302048 TaxID=3455945 RepID=UPI003FA05AA5